jgi:adenylate cyclase
MTLHIYLPQDRWRALARGEALPNRISGAALFADISGFTAMTEALHNALGARRGGEELTRRIEAVYSALITQIELFGGSVIGFAGDSMLCWFDDDLSLVAENESMNTLSQQSAPHRAVACGVALQHAMRAFAKIVLPDNSVIALVLKVAIANGTARRFVVGDPKIHIMDIVAGATISRTATGERQAQKGDVIVDESTAIVLADDVTIQEWREAPETHERFAVIDGLGQPIDPPVLKQLVMDYPLPEELSPWLHVPLIEREQTGQAAFLTEFRPCIAMFVRFRGIDFDQDEAGAQLDTFTRQAQAIVSRHGGTFLQLTIGDKGSYAYMNFGALSAHEDDARRAVRASLELREAAHESNFLAPLQMGLAQGILRVGAYGGHTRKTFGALGDEVNLAARLMMTAAPDEILISSQMQKAVEGYFVFEPRPPLSMKGKAEPVPVFAVTGHRKQRAIRLQEPTYALPMVGRQNELEIMNERLDLVLLGKSQIIGVVADAGMGKSRFVAEAIRLAHKKGFIGYGGACQSDGVNTPYLAWKSIWSAFFDIDPTAPLKKQMRSIENVLEDYAPNRLQAIPLLNSVLDMAMPENDFTSSLEPPYRKSTITALFEDCLRAASKDEPILIVLEDLHWIDALSHDLLEELAKSLVDCPVCFVLAYRPPHLMRLQVPRLQVLPQFTHIELRELDQAEAEQAIRAKLAQLYPARMGSVPPQLVDKLMRRAQGNPFFLEELLNYLRDRGLDPRDPADLKKIELPDSLHSLVLSRIDQLSEHEKTTLRVASIVGRLFRAAWLTGYYPALGELAHVKVVLDKLEGMDITPLDSEPELAYLFKHIVTHEVTYENLPFGLRAQLHEQLARFLEQLIATGAMSETALLETLVFHYSRTENKLKQRLYMQKAGRAALETSAFNTALEYFTRLLELTPEDDPTRSTLGLQLAEAHYRLSNFSEARSAIEQALGAARNDADRAAALALLGELASTLGNYAEAEAILTQAVALSRTSGAPLILCRALSALGNNGRRLGKLEEAGMTLHESLALARKLGDVTDELIALTHLGTVADMQGDFDKGQQLFIEVHKRAVSVGNRARAMSALNNLGVVADEKEDYTAAQTYFQEALALAREIGAQQNIAQYLTNLAIIDLNLGQLNAARLKLQEGLVLALRLRAMPWVISALTTFAEIAYFEGRTDLALVLYGLARNHPAWSSDDQRSLDASLTAWGLDPSFVEAAMAKGAKLDWNKAIEELL